MGLAESQRLLARLYTDAPLRGRFAADPESVAADFGLTVEEAKTLASLAFEQLDNFAGSLIGKRRGEVELLLPLTARALKSRFADLFRRHATSYVPSGIKKHRNDAVAFAEFLGREVQDPLWLADLVRFESANLRAHDPSRRWSSLRLRHHPIDLARATRGGDITPRRTWVLWYRLSATARLRRAILAWPITSPSSRRLP